MSVKLKQMYADIKQTRRPRILLYTDSALQYPAGAVTDRFGGGASALIDRRSLS